MAGMDLVGCVAHIFFREVPPAYCFLLGGLPLACRPASTLAVALAALLTCQALCPPAQLAQRLVALLADCLAGCLGEEEDGDPA